MISEAADFAAMVRGDHPDAIAYRNYVLAELRLARRRARLLVKEIDVIGIALRNSLIEPDVAVVWLAEANALRFLCSDESFCAGNVSDAEAEEC